MRIELSSDLPRAVPAEDRPSWRVVVAALATIGGFTLLATWTDVSPILTGGAVALLALFLWRAEETWRQARRRPATRVPRQWEITGDGIRVSGGGSVLTWKWAAVDTVREEPDTYFLLPDAGAGLDIPRPALSADQDAELRADLVRRGLLNG